MSQLQALKNSYYYTQRTADDISFGMYDIPCQLAIRNTTDISYFDLGCFLCLYFSAYFFHKTRLLKSEIHHA